MVEGDVELLAGNPEAAEAALRAGQEALSESAETGYLATVIDMRAAAAVVSGRDEDALRYADEVERLAAPDDFEPHVRQGCVRAIALARRGDFAAADEEIRKAEATASATDYLTLHIYVAMSRAEVTRLAGREAEEREALEQALALAKQKGNLVTAEKARARLGELA